MKGWFAGLVVGACASTACTAQTYQCLSADQCNGGLCQPSGFCSFPDPACDSGQRYGGFAGDGLGGQCVAREPDTDASTSEAGETTVSFDPSSSSGSSSTGAASGSTAALEGGTTTGFSMRTTGEAASSGSTGAGFVDPDLIAWWRLDNDPANGAQDATENQLDGTCTECPVSVPAVRGNGFGFTGEEVITVDEPEAFVAETFTVSAWARIETVEASYQHIVTKPVGTGSQNSWEVIIADTTSLQLQFVVSNTTQSRATAAPPQLGAWFHVAGSYDGDQVRLYLDGVLEAALSGPMDGVGWTDHPVVIGGDIDNGVLRPTWVGDLDDIRVYRRALDDAEIAQLASLR